MRISMPVLALFASALTIQSCVSGDRAAGAQDVVSGPVPPAPFAAVAGGEPQGRAPLRGVDFWGLDAMHVPEIPSKNFMPNPSFRQGLRYWWKLQYGPVFYTATDLRRFEVVDCDRGKALLIRSGKQRNAAPLLSFPTPLVPGKEYTLSCYAKSDSPKGAALTLALSNNKDLFFWRRSYAKETQFPLSNEWTRCVLTVKTSQAAPNGVVLNVDPGLSCGDVYATDLQLEEGPVATDFEKPAAEGLLTVSSPSNNIWAPAKIDAKFESFCASPGKLRLKLFDYWRKCVWEKELALPLAKSVSLPFDDLKLGTGEFCLQAVWLLDDGKSFCDYYRLSLLAPLQKSSATSRFFGAQLGWGVAWDDLLLEQYAKAGFSNHAYENDFYAGRPFADFCDALRRCGVENQCSFLIEFWNKKLVAPADGAFMRDLYKKREFSSEDVKRIEETARLLTLENPRVERMALSCEGETHSEAIKAGRWDEWEKAVMAAWRGVKRANPNVGFFPDTGTSCYLPNRGYRETEELFKIGERNGVKWDYVAAHPYSILDGSYFFNRQFMLDDTLGHLVENMKLHGYGPETPIYVSECFNLCTMQVPEWGCGDNADVYGGPRASYDFGRLERNHAAWAVRTYLVLLKRHPQIKMVNLWGACFSNDLTGSFISLPPAVNALRRLFPNPEFVCDFQPDEGVHAYAFKGDDGRTTVALWTSRELVEKELQQGVEFKFAADDPSLELIDFMGNKRELARNAGGKIKLLLDAAPLYLVAKDGSALIEALKNSECAVSPSSFHVRLAPLPDGSIEAKVENKAKLPCRFSHDGRNEEIQPFSASSVQLKAPGVNAPGEVYRAGLNCSYQYQGLPEIPNKALLIYCYAPRSSGTPDWRAIPGFKLFGYSPSEADFSARCQLAWNEDALFIRISAKDDCLFSEPEKFQALLDQKRFWSIDGGLELYIDAGGNGKSNLSSSMDNDDYRYDFCYPTADRASGKGLVYRRQEPNAQLMGGTDAPTKEEAAKSVGCDFEKTGDGYVYTITLPKRYLTPLSLAQGAQFGLSMSLMDIDKRPGDAKTVEKRLCLSMAGLPNDKPSVWASVVLSK